MMGYGYKPVKFSLKSTVIVLSALFALVGCGDSNKKPTKVWTEVYKEYPDGTVIRWEIRGLVNTKNGCISWEKNDQEEICLCGSVSVITHRDPIEVPAKAPDNEKNETKEGGKEKKEESK